MPLNLPEFTGSLKGVLAEFAKQVADFDAFVCSSQPASAEPDVATHLEKIIAVTNELFPGTVEIERSPDPEFPEDVDVVFLVKSSVDLPTTIRQEREWHKRVSAIAPGSKTRFRILVSDQ